MPKPQNPSNQPGCAGCLHLVVTYRPAQPYGCRAFGFQSRSWPWRVVLEESGSACQAKELRAPMQRAPSWPVDRYR